VALMDGAIAIGAIGSLGAPGFTLSWGTAATKD